MCQAEQDQRSAHFQLSRNSRLSVFSVEHMSSCHIQDLTVNAIKSDFRKRVLPKIKSGGWVNLKDELKQLGAVTGGISSAEDSLAVTTRISIPTHGSTQHTLTKMEILMHTGSNQYSISASVSNLHCQRAG